MRSRKNTKPKSSGKRWNWDLFKERLRELGEEEVTAAQQIIELGC